VRVFITGSAGGLGRAAAQTLLDQGHDVVVHTRNRDRLTAVRDLLDRGAAAVVGDLSDLEETRGVALRELVSFTGTQISAPVGLTRGALA
jgi:NAD(P)-dependent dehydrogenase (short-subunit alcohol dehydrogenase family)